VEERNAEIVGRIFNDEELVILLVLEVRWRSDWFDW
jgi:hypothetical protein